MNNWYKIATQNKEYMIEKGILFDENGNEVFSMKELIRFNVPFFKTHEDANTFLANLEIQTKKKYGRVPEHNLVKELRYKDTRKEKQDAAMQDLQERNKRWQKGDFTAPKSKGI